jgi:hypothetical protein
VADDDIVCLPLRQGVSLFAAKDQDDEMMMEMLMKEEADVAANIQQRLLILTDILHLRDQINVGPGRGGSRARKAKNKGWHRLAGIMLFDSDCFKDDTTHTAKTFGNNLGCTRSCSCRECNAILEAVYELRI